LFIVGHFAVSTATRHYLTGRVVEKMRPRKDAKCFTHAIY
jgi:hypothetical protein